MSRARTRPTRQETRQRIFEAAAEVFVDHGVPSATVDQIVEAAGFTRGAFYSNFSSKEELALAMLDDHLASSIARNRRLLEEHADPAGFVEALGQTSDQDGDPLHQNPVLQVELMLFVAGTPELRPHLGEHVRTMRRLVGEIAASTVRAAGRKLAVDPIEAGTILVALEDGLRLHRLVDPASTREDAFIEALRVLQRVFFDERRRPPRMKREEDD